MHVCLDVGYDANAALAACVAFKDWLDEKPLATLTTRVEQVSAYVPGEFYRRELPCLLAVLRRLSQSPSTILIDGHVILDDFGRAGLGMHLYESLNRATPVIGVAKSAFHGLTTAVEIRRGGSLRPLYVTSAGIDLAVAAADVQRMHGEHRVPTLIRLVDRLSRRG